MKFLVFTLSILCLSLSSIPCCVVENDNIWADDQSQNDIHSDKENHDDNSCDEPCSPFYTCGSCTGFSLQNIVVFSYFEEYTPVDSNHSYQNYIQDCYKVSAFKPPKVI